MKGYKFLNEAFVNSTLKGRIRLATLDYYRNLEGPQWIADATEGSQATSIRNFTFRYGSTQAETDRQKLSQLGIRLGRADNVQFIDCTAEVIAPQAYVFCFSVDPFDNARKAMCEDAPADFRYDSCIEIADVEAFVQWVSIGQIDGVPMTSLIEDAYYGTVFYDKETLDFEFDGNFRVDPFSKHKTFEYQQEYRLFYLPKRALPDTIFVDFLVPPGLLRRKQI